MKDLLVHAVIVSQENNLMVVTQVEAYFHEQESTMLQNKSAYTYSVNIEFGIEECEMGSGTCFETTFRYKKLEFIATGGVTNGPYSGINAFLGVAVFSTLVGDTNFLWFAPTVAASSSNHIRILRNYKKKASLKKWCFKSDYFAAKGFTTPNQLELFETKPNGSVSICSEFLFTVVNKRCNEAKASSLYDQLIEYKFYELIGFNALPNDKKSIINRLEEIKRKTVPYKLSRAKILLIELILNQELSFNNRDLMLLYNEIVSVKVKSLNNKSVQKMLE